LTHLIDTDIASYLAKKNQTVVERILKLDTWAISSITSYELTKGMAIRGLGQWSKNVEELLTLVEIMPFDEAAAKRAGWVSAELRANGKPSGWADELIAGHAISLGLTLVTNNLKHFEHVPGLKVESWA
jgi:tRNA(fMet)-specific endonuclease VapC